MAVRPATSATTGRPTSKLTLNLGLRFEMYPLMTRADSGIERLDYHDVPGAPGRARGNVPEDVGINVKSFYVAPRLGASYRINEETVLRAGYGRTFNPLPWSRPMRGSFPFDIFFNQTAEQYGAFNLQNGIPPVPHAGPQLRPRAPAPQHVHPHRRPRTTWTAPPSSR